MRKALARTAMRTGAIATVLMDALRRCLGFTAPQESGKQNLGICSRRYSSLGLRRLPSSGSARSILQLPREKRQYNTIEAAHVPPTGFCAARWAYAASAYVKQLRLHTAPRIPLAACPGFNSLRTVVARAFRQSGSQVLRCAAF